MRQAKILFFLSFILLFFTIQIQAQRQGINPTNDTLKVGLAGIAPFILENKTNHLPEGIAVEIWEDIAKIKNWKYKYVNFNTVNEALHSLNRDQLDMVVGPISITSQRVTEMNFSQPYYQSSLAIVSRIDNVNLWDRVKPFFSFRLLTAIGLFLLILAMVGALLWLAERKESPEQFPKNPIKGIANGMWLAIVTMSTTGYGDMAPVTLRGRVVAGAWMIVSIIFATSMVAGIASTLTLSGLGTSTITNVEQLSNKNVVTIVGSPSVDFLKEYNANAITVNDLDTAIEKLNKKEVEALVYDRPQLLYYLKNNHIANLQIANAEYYKQGYGFAFPLKSTIIYEVNRTLLELTEDHKTDRIIKFYLGKSN